MANTATLYFQFGTLTTLPRRRSRSASRTSAAASSHRNSGVFAMSMPARWWNSVRTYPGHRAITRTPNGATDSATDSLKFVTHAFEAGYVEPGMAAPKPETDETLMTAPARRFTMPGRTAS